MAITRKAPLRAAKTAAPIYQLRIELLDVHPAIWRRVLVPGSIKLHKLHAVLLWTMGWAGGHQKWPHAVGQFSGIVKWVALRVKPLA